MASCGTARWERENDDYAWHKKHMHTINSLDAIGNHKRDNILRRMAYDCNVDCNNDNATQNVIYDSTLGLS